MAKMFQVYGIGQALIPVLPPPIAFQNAPTSNQTNYEIGQLAFTPPKAPTAFYLYGGGGNWIELTDVDGPVQSVTGTANQILASPTTGDVVLSLIGPYTPATYTAHGVLIGEGTSSIVATSPGTTGQVLTSNGASADPSFQTLPGAPTTGTVQTTDATPTAVLTLPLGATAGVYTIIARIAGFASVGAGTPLGIGYTIEGAVRTDGASATLIDQGADAFEEGAMSACVGELTVSGNNAVLQVTGVAAYTIDWSADLSSTFAHA